MSGLTSSIATATKQQTFVANEISGLIEKINTHSVESNELSRHALADTSQLEEAAKRLELEVDAVKLPS